MIPRRTPGSGGSLQRHALDAATLLGSGAIAALSFMLLTSERYRAVDPALAAYVTLFVQWQVLGLTIAKLGLDTTIFAVLSHSPGRPDLRRPWSRFVLPVAVAFGCLTYGSFGTWGALACAVSIALDAASASMIAWHGARRRFGIVARSSLLNYPLFLALVVLGIYTGHAGHAQVAAAFVLSSAARLTALRLSSPGEVEVTIPVDPRMGLQQSLNYLLFKGDQVLLAPAVAGLAFTHDRAHLGAYLFLARFPDLASAVAVSLGAILLPMLAVDDPGSLRALASQWKLTVSTGVGIVLAGAVAYLAFLLVWSGSPIPMALLLPFLLAALLVLPANVLTYSMLRTARLPILERHLAFALVPGLVVTGIAIQQASLALLAWAVPTQLLSFVVISARRRWSVRAS